jgi:His-Xaa-Ser system protein HxsD
MALSTVDPISIAIDSRVYVLDVIQRAAFRCTDLASFNFSIASDIEITVTATVKPTITLDPDELRSRFYNELLDQQLRRTIANETKVERDLILGYAFSNTKLLG